MTVRRVRDPQYWGLPYGTPITAHIEEIGTYSEVDFRYVPGRWQKMSKKAQIEQIFETMVQAAEKYGPLSDQDLSELEDGAREHYELLGDRDRYTNGPHVVEFAAARDIDREAIFTTLDELMRVAPLIPSAHIDLTFTPVDRMPPGSGDMGATYRGTGIMMIAEHLLDPAVTWKDIHGEEDERTRTWMMPVWETVHPLIYTLVHEWGHTFDHMSPEQRKRLGDTFRNVLSGYSKYNEEGDEAYAEAFTEWFLRHGKPEGGAMVYANLQGWEWPGAHRG